MTASAATIKFLDQLRFRGVELWVEGDRLKYSAPKGTLNDDVLNELRKRKDEILAHLQAATASATSQEIVAASRDQLLALSFAQQRIWFLDELEPDNPFYNVALAKRIRGDISTDILRKSLLTLIRRHEVLRSVCVNTPDGPRLQIIAPDEIDADGEAEQPEQRDLLAEHGTPPYRRRPSARPSQTPARGRAWLRETSGGKPTPFCFPPCARHSTALGRFPPPCRAGDLVS